MMGEKWLSMIQSTIEGEEAGRDVLDMTSGLLGMQWETKIHAAINLDASPQRKVTIRGDFTKLPFKDASFEMVLFDPPHTVDSRNTLLGTLNPQAGSGPHLAAFKYGCYRNMTDLRKGVSQGALEAWRVLRSDGVMIFKWSNSEKPFSWAHDTITKVTRFQVFNIQIKSSKANPKNLTTLHHYRKP